MSIKRLAYDTANDGARSRQQARRPEASRVAMTVGPGDALGASLATGRSAPLPEAARRLRLMFPRVWARYEALVAARSSDNPRIH